MGNIKSRVEKLEERSGARRKGPQFLVFKVIGWEGEVLKTETCPINYGKGKRDRAS